MLTQKLLKELLHYDPETGDFTWIKCGHPWRNGQKAGSKYWAYWMISINFNKKKVRYLGHRLAWFYMHGVWPTDQIDHIDGNGLNNKISNLREASIAENNRNCGKRANNTSGYRGVQWSSHAKKWKACCRVSGKLFYLGHFDDIKLAAKAYIEFAKTHHGEFYREIAP